MGGGGETAPLFFPPPMPSEHTSRPTTAAPKSHPVSDQPPPSRVTASAASPSKPRVITLGLLSFFFVPLVILLVTPLFSDHFGHNHSSDYPTFQLDYLSLSLLRMSSFGRYTANTTDLWVCFSGGNPSDTVLVYYNIALSVWYEKQIILLGSLPNFYHRAGEKVAVRQREGEKEAARSVAVLTGAGQSSLVLMSNWFPKTTRTLSVRMDMEMRPRCSLRVWCEDLKVEFDSEVATMPWGQPLKCRVKVLST